MRRYLQDYVGRVEDEDTAKAIEEGRFTDIDRCALADEVRDLGRTERRELSSALPILLFHLFKAKYQPERATRSWRASIQVQRKHLATFLQQSPSLRPELPRLLSDAYEPRASTPLRKRTWISTFSPESCEWAIASS